MRPTLFPGLLSSFKKKSDMKALKRGCVIANKTKNVNKKRTPFSNKIAKTVSKSSHNANFAENCFFGNYQTQLHCKGHC